MNPKPREFPDSGSLMIWKKTSAKDQNPRNSQSYNQQDSYIRRKIMHSVEMFESNPCAMQREAGRDRNPLKS